MGRNPFCSMRGLKLIEQKEFLPVNKEAKPHQPEGIPSGQ
jgi:hypothetical protein